MAAAGGGGTIANLQVQVGADVAAALLGFATLQGAIGQVVDAVKGFVSEGIKMNAFAESAALQLTTLTGSAGTAAEKLDELFQVAARTPFTFESVVTANRQLQVFGGAALATRDNLTLLGDSAAATGARIEEVTFWTGRLYSQLEAGRPIGEASRWLQRMGVLSGEARLQLDALAESGAAGPEVWAAYTASLQRFSGAMAAQEKTWLGLISTMQDRIALLEGMATKNVFGRLETQVDSFNQKLADPHTGERAQQFGAGLALGFDLATNSANAMLAPLDLLISGLDREAQAAQEAAKHTRDWAAAAQAANARDFAGAMEAAQRAMEPIPATMGEIAAQARDSWGDARQAAVQMTESMEVANRVLGAAAVSADAADRAMEHLRATSAAYRDEITRLGAQQPILDQQRKTAHDAEMQRLYEQGQALAHAGDLNQVIAQEQIAAQQFAAEQAEKAAKAAADAQEDAFKAAADAIRQKNQETADAIREAQQASQEAVRRAYVGTADEAEAQYRRILNASQGVADSMTDMQRELDEAANRQVRGGTAGTADAERELEDIRKRYLTLLPDLTALDRDYAAARQQSQAADLALAAAQRDLSAALAATGGVQTLQTAALQHTVTAAKLAADAARDHERAMAAQRGEAVALTNALKGVSAQQEAMSGVRGENQANYGNPSGGGFPFMPPLPRGPHFVAPKVINVNINGPVTTTQGDFQQSVVNAVQQADRTGGLALTRYASR
jgi:mevalonate kinase